MQMRLRFAVAAAVAVGLAAVVVASGLATAKDQSITVWLQVDAQNGWPDVVKDANTAFQQQHPGVNVNVQYQTWGEHLTKLDASLAGGNSPDVVELGNTETVKYMANGALSDLTSAKSQFPNSATWLQGLAESGEFNGKTYAVPYYAGARAAIYNVSLYKQAGVSTKAPSSLAQFVANGQKLMKKFGSNPNFSALYLPGRDWYVGMSFVYDYGGKIATQTGGTWQGTLESPQAIAGLTELKTVVRALSRANPTGDEAHPQEALVFAKGQVGSFVGNGWEWPYALDPKVGNPALSGHVGAFPMPSHTPGKYMPTFLGGSDLAVPVTTKNKSLAIDWIKDFTSTAAETKIALAGNIPNTTSLVKINAAKPTLGPFAKAAEASWFVPAAKNWANVENANVLQSMLSKIISGHASVQSAAKAADQQITQILNASS
jgi:N,N'-diacetylchitobiose transport system substrate-binding protein